MNRYEIYQMCLRKKAFKTITSAKKAAAKRPKVQLYVYRCSVCLGFHLTSKSPETVKKRYLLTKLIYDGFEISHEDEFHYYIELDEEKRALFFDRGWRMLNGNEGLFRKKKSAVQEEIRERELKKYLAECETSELSISSVCSSSDKNNCLSDSIYERDNEVGFLTDTSTNKVNLESKIIAMLADMREPASPIIEKFINSLEVKTKSGRRWKAKRNK